MTKTAGFGNLGRHGNLILAVLSVFIMPVLARSEPNAADNPGTTGSKALPPVFSITDPRMVTDFTANSDRIREDFGLLLATAGGSSNPAEAWKKWIKPGQRIGIKISSGPGKIMGTRPALVNAIVASLIQAGHPPSNIIIFDRYSTELQDAGWMASPRDDGVKVTASWPNEGFDPEVFYNCSYAGKLIWGDLEFKGQQWNKDEKGSEQLGNRSYFSKVVTKEVDVIINVPSLSTHPGLGINGCIANIPLGLIDNQRRFFKEFFGREENIADLATHKALDGKWVLNIVDGVLGQYAGGPSFDPKYVWPQATLWLSEDPVALDAIGLSLINQKRPEQRIKPIDEETSAFLKSCEELGLGHADLGTDRLRTVPLPVR